MKQDFFKFPMHLIVHPFDGFWDLKYEGKGKVKVALIIVFVLFLTFVLQRQFAGFLVNYNDPRTLNSLAELQYVILPFFLWCIAGWSITTLMEGEGKFREIVMATAYSLVPIILIYLPMTLISRFLTVEESSFYYLFNTFAIIWFLYLLFVGTMTVHQYTPAKTILTMLLTVLTMGIMVFLGTLVFSLIQQMIEFIVNIYRELVFRI